MDQTPASSPSPSEKPSSIDRREFLERLSKTAMYAVPVVTYIASSSRAVAMSGAGGSEL